MKKKLVTGLVLCVLLVAGCSTSKTEKEFEPSDEIYEVTTHEEFNDMAIEFGLIPLTKEIIHQYGYNAEFTSVAVLDSPLLEVDTQDEFNGLRTEGHELFRAMFVELEGKTFQDSEEIFKDIEKDYKDEKPALRGENFIAHIHHNEETGLYGLLSIVENTFVTIDSTDKEAMLKFLQLLEYPARN